jgi:hypothetical protein
MAPQGKLDCFVATLLAMTERERQTIKNKKEYAP